MTRNIHTDKKIRELKQENKKLKQSIDISLGLYDDLQKERVSYRRIIKYYPVLMLLMNLIASKNGDTDIDRIMKRNIQKFYRVMTTDLMKLSTDNDENINYEFEDEEGYDDGEVSI